MRTGVIKNVSLNISEEMIRNEFSFVAKIVSVHKFCRRERKDSVLAKFQGQVFPQSLTFMHASSQLFLTFFCAFHRSIRAHELGLQKRSALFQIRTEKT